MPTMAKKEDNDSELEMERFQETPLSGEMPMAENLNDTSEYPTRDSKCDRNNEEDRSSPVEELSFPKMTSKRPMHGNHDDHAHKANMFSKDHGDVDDYDERPPREVAFLGGHIKRRHSMSQASHHGYKPVSHYLHSNLDQQPANSFQMTPLRASKRHAHGHHHHQNHGDAIGSAHTLEELYQCWNEAVDEGKLEDILRNEIDVGRDDQASGSSHLSQYAPEYVFGHGIPGHCE